MTHVEDERGRIACELWAREPAATVVQTAAWTHPYICERKHGERVVAVDRE